MYIFKSFTIVLVVSFVFTILGVVFFFAPTASADTARLSLPSVVGIIYLLLCAAIYIWALIATQSSYKAAAVVVLPQVALIIDLMLRGDRGPLTAVSGVALLVVTWWVAAFIHEKISDLAPE